MSRKHLGDTIDLHSGGEDLLFPHHENEIAQSEGCSGHLFSHHWFHCKFLLVDDRKMSKSLGNLYTLDDLRAKDFSPMAVRYALLAGHPRKQLNFTSESLNDAEKNIRWMALTRTTLAEDIQTLDGVSPSTRFDGVLEALRDDLNLPRAMGALHEALDSTIVGGANLVAFDRIMSVLGLTLDAAQKKSAVVHVTGVGAKIEVGQATAHSIAVPKDLRPGDQVLELSEKRWVARQAKDFATADALRKELAAAGWTMLDGKDGYKLEPLKH
jgi:cysteinyl-tRNA synthetase